MIRYRLQCNKKHEFEAWFGSSKAYDTQAKRGQVACPECGSSKVSKTLMTPGVATGGNVATRGHGEREREREPAQSVVTADGAKHAEMQRQFLAMLQNVRREVEKNAEYVGPSFAEEARKIHHEEVEARSIWGEATLEEARDLVEDGIDCLPLPRLPKDRN